jgi:KDO2-lipid IV(A) lauroyltransferase
MPAAATPPIEDPTCGIALQPLSTFLAPRWWPTWIGYGLMRGIGLLPWAAIRGLSVVLGRVAWYAARRDRRITLVNLRLAYPALDERARRALARRHFQSLIFSLFETALVWFDRRGRLERLTRVEGLEHLEAGLATGKGVLLLGAHFTTNEIAAGALPQTGHAFDVMYKRSANELLNQLALRGRLRRGGRLIPSEKFVEMLKVLKRGGIVLYAPDQHFDGDGCVVAPLFGVPALSNPGTTFVARATGCRVVPFFPERLADGSGYVMRILAPIEGFPSRDGTADVVTYHGLIEQAVRAAPDQYLWSYKRFRGRSGEPNPYQRGAR